MASDDGVRRIWNHGAGLNTVMLQVSMGDGVATVLAFCMMFL